MRIIHVLRKPFRGSVAQNVLEHGCGAINIDAARIAFRGEQSPSVERRASAAASGRAGRVTSAQRAGQGRFAAGQDVEEALDNYLTLNSGEFKGRWPANVILEHAEGCEIVGVRELPAHTSTERGWHTAYVGGDKKKVIETQTLGDADGTDRSDLWECEEGCPAADLNRDTEEDSGGASRFFLQLRHARG